MVAYRCKQDFIDYLLQQVFPVSDWLWAKQEANPEEAADNKEMHLQPWVSSSVDDQHYENESPGNIHQVIEPRTLFMEGQLIDKRAVIVKILSLLCYHCSLDHSPADMRKFHLVFDLDLLSLTLGLPQLMSLFCAHFK